MFQVWINDNFILPSQYQNKIATNISVKLWFLKNFHILIQKCPGIRFPGFWLFAYLSYSCSWSWSWSWSWSLDWLWMVTKKYQTQHSLSLTWTKVQLGNNIPSCFLHLKKIFLKIRTFCCGCLGCFRSGGVGLWRNGIYPVTRLGYLSQEIIFCQKKPFLTKGNYSVNQNYCFPFEINW